MANIKINDLQPAASKFAELSTQEANIIYGGGWNVPDVVGGAVTGFVVGSSLGMPFTGAVIGAIIGALK